MTMHVDPAERAALRARHPRAFTPSRRRRLAVAGGWAAFAALAGLCLWRTGFLDPARWWDGLGKLGFMVGFMFPPAHNGSLGEFLYAMLETLGMAFFGTLLAAVVAVPLGFLGARNVVPQWLLHFGIRRSFDALRGIDTLIWALVFVNVVGLGPFAGILAIAVVDIGTLSKLFAEAIENVDRRPVEGVRAAGANGIEVMRLGILPQVFPVMVGNILYFFESNTRSATILGVVGAGGIGYQLSDRIRIYNWDEACFIIIMIVVTVALIDLASKEIRMRLIGSQA